MDAAELLSVSNNCSATYLDPCDSVFVPYVYVLTPLCSIGVIFNCMNIAVFLSKPFYGLFVSRATVAAAGARSARAQHVSSTLIQLLALSVADVACLTLAIPMGIVRCVAPSGDASQLVARQVYEVIVMPLLNTFAAASVWLTTVIAVKRFRHVRRSGTAVKATSNSSERRRTWLGVSAIYVGALLAHLPYFFCKQIDTSRTKPVVTEFGASFGFEIYLWMRMVIVKLIPIAVTFVTNIALLVTVTLATRKLRQVCNVTNATATAAASPGVVKFQTSAVNTERARRRRVQEHRITAMLVTISMTFVLCQFGPCSIYQPGYNERVVTINILEMFSYAFKFVNFCVFELQFRSALVDLFRRPLIWCGRRCQCSRCCDVPADGASGETGNHDDDDNAFTAVAYSIRI